MNWLADNSLAIWMGGAIALTLSLVVYSQLRTNKALAGIVSVVVATAALLTLEWWLETPREAVERTLYELAATVEANDVPGALRFVAPGADKQIRSDIETMMPLVKIERARVLGAPEISVGDGPAQTSATVKCRGLIVATTKKDGMKGGAEDELTMTFVRDGERWLLETYTSKRNWNRAVGR